jgi:HAD superfamily hydrolase (TIGR01509 family)
LITAYLFDIDGTILDSAPDICAAVGCACADDGRQPPATGVIARYIGRPLAEMFADFYPGVTREEIERLSGFYRERYRARAHQGTRVFPGIAETLAVLPGRKSTATTKLSSTTAAVLELFGLRHHFHHIQGSDNGRYKPDPAILLEAAAALGVRPEECMMVGDAPYDIEAGRRAGMKTCAVAWGYGDPERLRSLRPDYWIASPAELLRL